MPFAHASGARVYYRVHADPGERTPLVLIRGMGRFSDHWGPLIDALARDFCLVTLDNRGTGRSEPGGRGYSTSDLAADVVAVMADAGIEQADVFGMSLGGMIAQRVALDHPRRVRRLVLGCTTAGGRRSPRGRLYPFARIAAARIGGDPRRAVMAEARFILTAGFLEHHHDLIARWVELRRSFPVSTSTALRQVAAALRHDVHAQLDSIQHPTLVLSAPSDPLVPAANARLLARAIPRAELAWISPASHDFTTERPEEVARRLRLFLQCSASMPQKRE
ncbi:MAG: alpha/beta hydrolase [Myxococcota bacterium]